MKSPWHTERRLTANVQRALSAWFTAAGLRWQGAGLVPTADARHLGADMTIHERCVARVGAVRALEIQQDLAWHRQQLDEFHDAKLVPAATGTAPVSPPRAS